MHKQKGAALVIVLAILTGSLMIGVSGMNSALIDERLAGNYRAASQAQMNAERAVSKAMEKFKKDKTNGDYSWGGARSIESLEDVGGFFEEGNALEGCNKNDKCVYEFLKINDEYWVLAKGRVLAGTEGSVIAESDFIKVNFDIAVSGGGGSGSGDYSDRDVEDLLGKIINSGNLINVLDGFDFTSSNNQNAISWGDKISSDSSLFETANDACLFRDALLNGEVASGLVEEFGANVNKNEFSNASGKIGVVQEDGFSLPNASDFSGVLMVFGRDFEISGGGNIDFNGAIIHVPVDCVNNNFYTPQIDIRGGNGEYNISAVESIVNQLDAGDDEPDNGSGEVTSNNDLKIGEWQWSFE